MNRFPAPAPVCPHSRHAHNSRHPTTRLIRMCAMTHSHIHRFPASAPVGAHSRHAHISRHPTATPTTVSRDTLQHTETPSNPLQHTPRYVSRPTAHQAHHTHARAGGGGTLPKSNSEADTFLIIDDEEEEGETSFVEDSVEVILSASQKCPFHRSRL